MTLPASIPSVLPLALPAALPISAQGATTGGPEALVLLVFGALLVATLLSVYLAYRLYRGYRVSSEPGMLLLGLGLVLLTTVPMLLRLVLTNVPDVEPTTRAIAATTSQLLGLVIILGVIYDYGR